MHINEAIKEFLEARLDPEMVDRATKALVGWIEGEIAVIEAQRIINN